MNSEIIILSGSRWKKAFSRVILKSLGCKVHFNKVC